MRNAIRISIGMLTFLFLISFVYAQEQSLGGVQLNGCVAFKQSYANSTFQNITAITYPDKVTIQVVNSPMTYLGQGLYNYTFCNLTQVGTYVVDGIGDVDGILQTWNYDMYASQLAITQTTSQGIGSAIYLVLMFGLMFTFGILGFRLFKSNYWWMLGLFFEFFAVLLLVYNVYLGYEYHQLFTGLPNSSIPETIFYIFLTLVVVGSLTCIGLLFVHWRKVLRYVKKEIKRKDERDEDLEDWDVDGWGGEKWQVKGRKNL